MLHRAANNAHSWWCASHIRTRQSKWLEQNLKDMEEKVQNMLQMLNEDADTFSKKAEMYYRKRPELIVSIKDSFGAYRALAERYDHISGELQNAYHTISSALPDQIHFASEEEEEEEEVNCPEKKIPKISNHVPDISKLSLNLPKHRKQSNVAKEQNVMSSSLIDDEAVNEEVDKIQKKILILQTEKEFMKSSYERALSKFLELEKQIVERQKEVCNLQDEHVGAGAVIEDDEARALMVATALKSCQDTLVKLQEQQRISADMVRIEFERIITAEEKLKSFKSETASSKVKEEDDILSETSLKDVVCKDIVEDVDEFKEKRIELMSICEKLKQYFEMKRSDSFSIVIVAEIVNELVNKVLTLGTAVSSQNALIERLKDEADKLQQHLLLLEEEKVGLSGESNIFTEKVQETEKKMNEIQDLIISIKDQNSEIRNELSEACQNLGGLTEKLHSPEMVDAGDEIISSSVNETEATTPIPDEQCPDIVMNDQQEQESIKRTSEDVPNSPERATLIEEHEAATATHTSLSVAEMLIQDKETLVEECPSIVVHEGIVDQTPTNDSPKKDSTPVVYQSTSDAIEDALWRKLLLHGLDDREKLLFEEYTVILTNYKETKKTLSDIEKKNQESMFQTMAEVRELKSSNARKELEIRSLKQKICILKMTADENSDNPGIEERRLICQSDNASVEEEIKAVLIDEESNSLSAEEKLRTKIDEILEVNLEFWLRFSNSFHQIENFRYDIEEIKADISKTLEMKKLLASRPSPKSEVARINKNLRELQKQLSGWLEQSALHGEELQCRFLSLGRIQDEITRVVEMNYGNDRTEFQAYNAEKFQGEVLNIQQENHKVEEELQAGVKYVRSLSAEINMILTKFNRKFRSSSRMSLHLQLNQLQSLKNTMSKTKVPLRSFLFGYKPKKLSKLSIFPFGTPSLNKQMCDLKTNRKHSI